MRVILVLAVVGMLALAVHARAYADPVSDAPSEMGGMSPDGLNDGSGT